MTEAAKCPCCGQPLPEQGGVNIDFEGGFIVANGRAAHFTATEMSLIEALHAARPRTVSKDRLLDALYWQASTDEEPEIKIIDVFVCKIRKKLKDLPVEIETAWGRGYRLIVRAERDDGRDAA